MAIDQNRRARLAAFVTSLPPEQVRDLKEAVQRSSGHPYHEVQSHAWGLCQCESGACPPWVERGVVCIETFRTDEQRVHLDDSQSSGQSRPDLAEVLDETALGMTGLLREVVLDETEIQSSKDAAEGDVFAGSTTKEK